MVSCCVLFLPRLLRPRLFDGIYELSVNHFRSCLLSPKRTLKLWNVHNYFECVLAKHIANRYSLCWKISPIICSCKSRRADGQRHQEPPADSCLSRPFVTPDSRLNSVRSPRYTNTKGIRYSERQEGILLI